MPRIAPLPLISTLVVSSALVWGWACENDTDDSRNVFPGDLTSADTGPEVDSSVMLDDSGAADVTRVAYRFTKLDIQQLGSQIKGEPTALQLNVLNQQWADDIENYKLSIMLTVDDYPESGTGTTGVRVGSGVGTNNEDQCIEPSSVAEPVPSDVVDDVISIAFPEQPIYIYSEDDEGVQFNCTPDPMVPDAVPIRTATGTATLAEDRLSVTGELLGCLTRSDAETLCTCLRECRGGQHPDCGGCPNGAVPLASLLGGIAPQEECTERFGADAFIIRVEFDAVAITVPELCEE